MIDWLQKTAGYTANGLTYEEKNELEQLRQEIGAYRTKEEMKNDDKQQKHESSEEV
jgi:hypothetical protein